MNRKKNGCKNVSTDTKNADSLDDCQSCQSHQKMATKGRSIIEMETNCMTNREFQILSEMRKVKGQANLVKKYLQEIEKSTEKISNYSHPPEGSAQEGPSQIPFVSKQDRHLNEERQCLFFWLKKLKDEWKALDDRRLQAAEERMRLLGHIE